MGNCIIQKSNMHWAGDDWGSLAPETQFSGDTTPGESYEKATDIKQEKLLVANIGKKAAAKRIMTQVKIKTTKKQLEELLGRMDGVKGLAVEEVVAQLMRAGTDDQTHQRSWRPALKSIQEVN